MELIMDNVIPLHKHVSKPVIDWEKVEAIRAGEYPKIPKSLLATIRGMFENPGGSDVLLEIDDFDDGYPPDPIGLAPLQGDAIWIMDLLDRYGGSLRNGKKHCVIRRRKKRPALYIVQPITPGTRQALHDVIGPYYEHFVQSKNWDVLGRDVTDKLMVFLITSREDEDKVYMGLFDRKTALILFQRLESGRSVDDVLGL
jgi:hypothetical protein